MAAAGLNPGGAERRVSAREARPRTGYEYIEGWGMAVGAPARVLRPRSVDEVAAGFAHARRDGVPLTLRGTGCSYGDASVNRAGHVLDVSGMDQILSFDRATGVADCEAGVTLSKLWRHTLPRGHWPMVVSGTMFPTLAGAAGMNIHGKNNFKVGTIGDAILEVDVVLPNGELVTLDRARRPDLFHAVIGGFGMLGAITRVKLKTKRIYSGEVDVKGVSSANLAEMMAYMDAHTADADYLVGWLDCFAGGAAQGRGLVHHARYLDEGEDLNAERTLQVGYQELPLSILGFPKGEVWRMLRLFNHDLGMGFVNWTKHQMGKLEERKGFHRQSHAAFNFLLDYVPNWKFAYGRGGGRGLIQYQVFVPKESAHAALSEVLRRSRERGHTSYLGVLKRHRPDPFLLTHALDGWSLALDFKVTPERRASLWATTDELTQIVLAAGGRFYFAKDAVIGPATARAMYPEGALDRFLALKREVDPDGLLQSDLWRRVFGGDPSRFTAE
ncbi:MAG: FAD-binding oxidoreductase [Planctomycetota bacterium]